MSCPNCEQASKAAEASIQQTKELLAMVEQGQKNQQDLINVNKQAIEALREKNARIAELEALRG